MDHLLDQLYSIIGNPGRPKISNSGTLAEVLPRLIHFITVHLIQQKISPTQFLISYFFLEHYGYITPTLAVKCLTIQ